MLSACFQISTGSRISGKKIIRFSPLKIYLSVTIKISKKSEDQNSWTTLKFYSAPHSVSKVIINAEGGSRFSPNTFPTSNYFQHMEIPEVGMTCTLIGNPQHHWISFLSCPVCPWIHKNLYFIYFLLSTTSFGKEFQRSVTCCMSNSSVLSTTPSSFSWCLLSFARQSPACLSLPVLTL